MEKKWSAPEIISLDIKETAKGNQFMAQDGGYNGEDGSITNGYPDS